MRSWVWDWAYSQEGEKKESAGRSVRARVDIAGPSRWLLQRFSGDIGGYVVRFRVVSHVETRTRLRLR